MIFHHVKANSKPVAQRHHKGNSLAFLLKFCKVSKGSGLNEEKILLEFSETMPLRFSSKGLPRGSKGQPEGSEVHSRGFETQPMGSEGLPKRSGGRPEGFEGQPTGFVIKQKWLESLRVRGSEGQRKGSVGHTKGS